MPRHPNQGKNQPFLQKLKESGIDLKVSNALRMGFLDVDDTAAALPDMPTYGRISIKIPYYNPFTEKPLPKKYARYRLLGEALCISSDKKAPKYLQPKGSHVYPYLPVFTRNSGMHIKWREVAQDVSNPLIFTEGEFKSICAALRGYPAIGLGGVDSFTEPRSGGQLLESLRQFVWRDRMVYIIYDSDMSEKPQVYAAACRLAELLTADGADVHICTIPASVGGSKVGLDDYLMEHSVPEFESDVLGTAQSFRDVSRLAELNKRLVYVEDGDHIYKKLSDGCWGPVSLARFTKFGDAANTPITVPAADGKTKKVSLLSRWLVWAGRAKAHKAEYYPGVSGMLDNGNLSVWPGWGRDFKEPRSKADIAPFYALFDFLFRGASPEIRKWALCWIAHTIQFPNIRNQTIMLLFSVTQGTGKSLLGDILRRLHGNNGRAINQNDLSGAYSGWQSDTTFVTCNEVHGGDSDSRALADKLKDITDAKVVSVRKMYMDSYEATPYFSFYFTTNRPDAFFLESSDRRNFVWQVPEETISDKVLNSVYAWLDSGGLDYLGYHLLQDIDLSKYAPYKAPPRTEAHGIMSELSKSSFESFIDDALDAPDVFISSNLFPSTGSASREIFSVPEIRDAYFTHSGERVKDKTVRNVLAVKRVVKVRGGERVRVTKPVAYKGVYYAFSNSGKWGRADISNKSIQDHIEGGF